MRDMIVLIDIHLLQFGQILFAKFVETGYLRQEKRAMMGTLMMQIVARTLVWRVLCLVSKLHAEMVSLRIK